MRGFGNLLILDHGADYIYGKHVSLLRGIGYKVRAGASVATVSASGGGEESGLYFELSHDGFESRHKGFESRHEGKAFDPR